MKFKAKILLFAAVIAAMLFIYSGSCIIFGREYEDASESEINMMALQNSAETMLFNPGITLEDIEGLEKFDYEDLTFMETIIMKGLRIAVVAAPFLDILIVFSFLDSILILKAWLSTGNRKVLVIGYNENVKTLLKNRHDNLKVYLWLEEVLSSEEIRELSLRNITVDTNEAPFGILTDPRKTLKRFKYYIETKSIRDVIIMQDSDTKSIEYYMMLSQSESCQIYTVHFYVNVEQFDARCLLQNYYDHNVQEVVNIKKAPRKLKTLKAKLETAKDIIDELKTAEATTQEPKTADALIEKLKAAKLLIGKLKTAEEKTEETKTVEVTAEEQEAANTLIEKLKTAESIIKEFKTAKAEETETEKAIKKECETTAVTAEEQEAVNALIEKLRAAKLKTEELEIAKLLTKELKSAESIIEKLEIAEGASEELEAKKSLTEGIKIVKTKLIDKVSSREKQLNEEIKKQDELVKKTDEIRTMDLRVFNFSELQAHLIFKKLPAYIGTDKSNYNVHILILGNNNLSKALLLHAMNQSVITPTNSVVIDLFGENIDTLNQELCERFNSNYVTAFDRTFIINNSKVDGNLRINLIEGNVCSEATLENIIKKNQKQPYTFFASCIEGDDDNLYCFSKLKPFLGEIPAALRIPYTAEMKRHINSLITQTGDDYVYLTGTETEYISFDNLIDREEENKIRAFNYKYMDLSVAPDSANTTEADKMWNDLLYYKKESNRALYHHIPNKRFIAEKNNDFSASVDAYWKGNGKPTAGNDFDQYEIDKLYYSIKLLNGSFENLEEYAKTEHRRFCYFYASEGWGFTTADKNEKAKLHNCLCTWAELKQNKNTMSYLAYDVTSSRFITQSKE